MPWLWKDDANPTNNRRDGDVFRLQSVSSVQKVVRVPPTTASLASPSVPSFLAAQPSEIQTTQMDVEPVSSDSFSMWNVPAGKPPEQDFLLEQLRSLSSSGITGQKALRAILQLYPDQQQTVTVANKVKRLQATMAQK